VVTKNNQPSPLIPQHAWGHLEIEGKGSFRDAKLFPGGAKEWDWNETGTRHVPGIQPADVKELLEHGAEVIVLSKGVHERLQVKDETLQMLEQRNVATHVLQTDEAIALYNKLVNEGELVGALIHSTC
jgi:hypothetical protein